MTQGKNDRERRLAEALRANLRRRKGQARERDETVEGPASAENPDAGQGEDEDEASDGR